MKMVVRARVSTVLFGRLAASLVADSVADRGCGHIVRIT